MRARILLLIAAFGLITALALPASAQGMGQNPRPGWQDRDHDRDNHDRDRYKDHRAYQDGMRDGQGDRGKQFRMRGNEWKGDDRSAYEAGYRAGYGSRGGPGGPMMGPGERNRGGSQAYRNGYAEGRRYGQNDLRAHRASTPTKSGYYEKATNGYTSNLGDKDQYRREYRQGYEEGYNRGYSGR